MPLRGLALFEPPDRSRMWFDAAAEPPLEPDEEPVADPGAVRTRAASVRRLSGALVEPEDPDTRLWSRSRIAAHQRSLDLPLQPIAILELPRLGLRAAVFTGTDDATLDRGVGHLPSTAAPGEDGNVAIAGHRDGFFRVLKDVALGDVLRLETPEGVREYTIGETHIVYPEQVHVLDRTPQPAVTLIACFPFYFVGHAPQRFIVRAYETH